MFVLRNGAASAEVAKIITAGLAADWTRKVGRLRYSALKFNLYKYLFSLNEY